MGSYPRLGCGGVLFVGLDLKSMSGVFRLGSRSCECCLRRWARCGSVFRAVQALGQGRLSFWTKPVLGFAMYF